MRTKENDTKKNCLKTVWGFKMSFFEEEIEFNFRFSETTSSSIYGSFRASLGV